MAKVLKSVTFTQPLKVLGNMTGLTTVSADMTNPQLKRLDWDGKKLILVGTNEDVEEHIYPAVIAAMKWKEQP